MKVICGEALEKLPHKLQVRFTVFCAEQVTHLLDDKTRDVALKAIEVTKLWLDGKATKEECRAAASAAIAAYYTTYASACAAAYFASYTASNAADAARAAYSATYAISASPDKKQIAQAQWDYYYELLNIDTNLEKILLGA